ncbi:MAG TPA: flagellar protein FliT [Methylophaga aminisulfidivorans]|uniref:Flagellar protein FliT n=1 Tax=Methylophaga aminisulfidivorans TaxID=230105 RepID=A0A7C1ZRN4_9GAMM|nr:flagellar protein FliT [Methylophaga aminisulfidivorans]
MTDKVILLRILKLTEQMLSAAEREEWVELAQLNDTRQHDIERAFPLTIGENSQQYQIVIAKIIEKNQSVEALCKQEHQSIKLELSHFNKSKKVASAYSEN